MGLSLFLALITDWTQFRRCLTAGFVLNTEFRQPDCIYKYIMTITCGFHSIVNINSTLFCGVFGNLQVI